MTQSEDSLTLAARALDSLVARTRDRVDESFAAVWIEAIAALTPEQIKLTMRQLLRSEELDKTRKVPSPNAFCAQARAICPDPLPAYVQEAAQEARQLAAAPPTRCLTPSGGVSTPSVPQNEALNASIIGAGVGRDRAPRVPAWSLGQYQRYFLNAAGIVELGDQPECKTRDQVAAMVAAQRKYSAQVDRWKKDAWRAAYDANSLKVDADLYALKLVESLEVDSQVEKGDRFVTKDLSNLQKKSLTMIKSPCEGEETIAAALDAL